MEERELVIKMQNGDEQAFFELYEKYKDTLFRTACLIVGNQADGEDVLQETFVSAYYHCKELKNPDLWKYWLFQILRRHAFRSMKKKKKEIPDENVLVLADKEEYMQENQGFFENEDRKEIWGAIEQLPLKQKTIIILFYFNDMSVSQISNIMECSEGTVKSRLFLARNRLKKLLLENNSYMNESIS